jgi:hypothetical protein
MGQDLEQSKKFAARRLKCDDPIVRNKYSEHYEQYIEKKQLRERSRKLASDAKELVLTQQQAQEYEQLDALRKKGVYEAQQQCRKFCTGEKTGHKKLHYWESESYSGSWHAIGYTGSRFKDGITQG